MSFTHETESAVFFKAWLRAPLRIGSFLPSSRAMGKAFAKLLEPDRPGDVLELGSGTGAISQALLDAGLPAGQLIMVEREPELVVHLRRRFPGVRIMEGNATEIGAMLKRENIGGLAAVVSTLPIVWFPLEEQATVLDDCFAVLREGGSFLQMTNFPTSPLPMKKLGLAGKRIGPVWRNVPPSYIWRYARR